jgi:hypothetical protein
MVSKCKTIWKLNRRPKKKKKKRFRFEDLLLRIFSANVLLILSPLSFRFVSKLEKTEKEKEMSSGKKMAIKILSLFWVSVVDFYVKTNLCLQMEKLFLLHCSLLEFHVLGAKTAKACKIWKTINKNKKN